jgi:hypothetical protein
MRIKTALLLSLIFVSYMNAKEEPSMKAEMGKPQKFQKDVPVHYPDFTVTYKGGRMDPNQKPRPMGYDDFEISAGNEKKTVSWTSGSGDISAAGFKWNGRWYTLDLVKGSLVVKPNWDEEFVVAVEKAPDGNHHTVRFAKHAMIYRIKDDLIPAAREAAQSKHKVGVRIIGYGVEDLFPLTDE